MAQTIYVNPSWMLVCSVTTLPVEWRSSLIRHNEMCQVPDKNIALLYDMLKVDGYNYLKRKFLWSENILILSHRR